jgi:hypothetical protein
MTSIAVYHPSRAGRLRGIAAGLAAALVVASCSVAGSSPSASAPARASTEPPASPTAVATPTATPAATGCSGTPASATTGASALPSVPAAPAGKWTCINWISAGKAFPQIPAVAASDMSRDVEVKIKGWSRGYVGFRSVLNMDDPRGGTSPGILATSSSDGLHWTAGSQMDVTGLGPTILIQTVVEGPAGLLAGGMYMPGACGGPASYAALWTSPDGLDWTRVRPPDDFVSASIYTIDAGSTGYIAEGTLVDGTTQAVWLSKDGRNWTRAPLPKATIGDVILQGATDFAGGFVLSGAIPGDEGCGGYRYVTPSLWWSADGQSWTRSKLDGATPASDAWMVVVRMTDRELVAMATEFDQATQAVSTIVWTTTDGRQWSLVANPATVPIENVSDGRHVLVVTSPADDGNPPVVQLVADDLTATKLDQVGDVPNLANWVPESDCALGPTGIVVLTRDGQDLWLGVPVAP